MPQNSQQTSSQWCNCIDSQTHIDPCHCKHCCHWQQHQSTSQFDKFVLCNQSYTGNCQRKHKYHDCCRQWIGC
jgi:hypothetical protein